MRVVGCVCVGGGGALEDICLNIYHKPVYFNLERIALSAESLNKR